VHLIIVGSRRVLRMVKPRYERNEAIVAVAVVVGGSGGNTSIITYVIGNRVRLFFSIISCRS